MCQAFLMTPGVFIKQEECSRQRFGFGRTKVVDMLAEIRRVAGCERPSSLH